jgi:transketolase C-terminal domain/subunit
VLPSTPYDAKGLLKTAIRDENPVAFFEDKMMYRLKGPVPEEEYTIPFGVADIKRPGTDITIVATSSMVQVALGAAKLLEASGRAPDLSRRVKHSWRLRNCVRSASCRRKSPPNRRHTANDAPRTSGFSILLNQPMSSVA